VSVIDELSCSLGIKSEQPNQELAAKLTASKNRAGIKEVAQNLWNSDKKIANGCIKVLYEIGERSPELIVDYSDDFFSCLQDKNNRLVWGGMTALSTIAVLIADEIAGRIDLIKKTIGNGSVITVDRGVLSLSKAAAVSKKNHMIFFAYLLEVLAGCRPNSVAQYSESTSLALTKGCFNDWKKVVDRRKNDLNASAKKRVEKLIRKMEKQFME
jgi:hypothetical protein